MFCCRRVETKVVKVSQAAMSDTNSATMTPKEKRNTPPSGSKVAAKRRRKGGSSGSMASASADSGKPAGLNSAGKQFFDGLLLDLVGIIFAFLNGDSWGRWCAMAKVSRVFLRWHVTMLPKQLQIDSQS